MRPAFLITVLLLVLAACSGAEESRDAAPEMDFTGSAAAPPQAATMHSRELTAGAPVPAPAPPRPASVMKAGADVVQSPAAQPGSSGAPSMLIRTGSASVEVDDVTRAIAAVRQLAISLGGQVANTNVQSGREQVRTATLELRIPAQQFDRAVSGLEPIGRVESVQVDAQDVGEEYVDLTARMANARRLEERLVSLLATRTGRLEDVLAVERELARVREEIERFQGRLRYLETRVATSTLAVTVHEPHPVLARGQNPITEAFRDAWRNFVGFIAGMIALSGVVLPAAALAGLGYVVVRRVLVRRRLVAE